MKLALALTLLPLASGACPYLEAGGDPSTGSPHSLEARANFAAAVDEIDFAEVMVGKDLDEDNNSVLTPFFSLRPTSRADS